jgi:hypothetical protein
VLVDGALADRSAGAPLAALLAPHFTVYTYDRRGRGNSGDTQPFTVDREIEDLHAILDEAGDAVAYFMIVGVDVSPEAVAEMRQAPFWAGLEAIAHTIAYDGMIMGDAMNGSTTPLKRWASATVPTLVVDGSASPQWMHNGSDAIAEVLPEALRRTLEGQTHAVDPAVLAPVVEDFFSS